MAVINVTVSGQTNPSVEISGQTNPSVTINTIPRGALSGQIVSNDAEIAALIAATGTLTGATGALSIATGVLDTSVSGLETATGALSTATGTLTGATGELSTATGALSAALTDPTGALSTSLNGLSGTLTGVFNNDLTNLSGNLTGSFNNGLNNLSGTLTGVTGAFAQTGQSAYFTDLDVSGPVVASGIIKSSRINVGTGKLYVDDDSTNYSVKLGAYGQGTFFGKDGAANGAQYTLAVGTGGKICEDIKVETFKISGDGFLNLHTSPKTLISTPGAGKAIVVHQVTFYVDHNGLKGTSAGGFDNDGLSCYTVGMHQDSTYDSSESFYACAGLPRVVLNSEAGDFLWAGEPDEDYRILADRPLLLRSPSLNNITTANTSSKPGGAHYIKIRYQILNLASDFRTIENLTSITS